MKKALTFLLMVLLLHPLSFIGAQGENNAREGYQTQTIMMYVIGSDLESEGAQAVTDISEMLKAKPDQERLNVLVMTGGTNLWHSRAISSDKLTVFKIEGASPKEVHAWDKASMGDTAVLTRFLDYARESYPADSYGLILWDHGGGPMVGFGLDTAFDYDGLSLTELREALSNSTFKGEDKLEWLAFDACLMASMEVASMMSGHAGYLIASQEALPGQGFDYRFLKELSFTGLTGPEVGKAIIDYTYSFYEAKTAKHPENQATVTLSLMDLSRMANVQEKLNGLFLNLDRGLEAGIYSDIARGRDRTKDYGSTTTTNAFDLIDLKDLSDNLAGLYPDRAGELGQALEGMVRYNRSNAPRTNGVSLYFPLRNKNMLRADWGEMYQGFDMAASYKQFMERFAEILLSDSLSSWTGDDAPAVTQDAQTGEYFVQLSPEQVANFERAEYYILARLRGEEYMLTFMSGDVQLDEDGRLSPNFNGIILSIEDEQRTRRIIPYLMETENIDGIARYQIPMIVTGTADAGESWSLNGQLLAQIDKQQGQASIIGAIRDNEPGSLMGKRDLDLQAWNTINFTHNSSYLTRDEEGALLPYGDWPQSGMGSANITSFNLKEGLKVTYEPVDQGLYEYFVLMSAVDTQGYAYSSELMPLAFEAGEPKKPSVPQVKTVRYAPGDPARLFGEYQGIEVSLAGIEQLAPDNTVLRVYLMLENKLNTEAGVYVNWTMADGVMKDSGGGISIVPGSSELLGFDLSIESLPQGTGLLQTGIKRLSDLRFGLLINPDVVNSLGWGALNMSGVSTELQRIIMRTAGWSTAGELRVETDLAIEGAAETFDTTGFTPEPLWSGGGITIELAGEPVTAGEELIVPLKITNESDMFDLVRLEESAVNGIMIPMTMPGHVQPGGVLYASARVNIIRQVLPPELAEFQQMMDLMQASLEGKGIDRVRDITLRFELDNSATEGMDGLASVRRQSGYIRIPIPGMEDYEQPLDTQGEELYAAQDIQVIRLDSDPEGKTLYIENRSDKAVRVIAGFVKADQADYNENIPVYAKLSPHSAAYTRLFDLIIGIEPEADEISFYLSLIDLDENRLMERSKERIVLSLLNEKLTD